MNVPILSLVSCLLLIAFFTSKCDAAAQCYQCSGTQCDSSSTQNCGNTLTNWCQKITTVSAGVTVYTKGCSTSCIDGASQTFGPTTITYKCCTSDLCNDSVSNLKFSQSSKMFAIFLGALAFAWRNFMSKN